MLIQLLGKENVSSLSLQDTAERFRLIGMYGKAANIGDDISAAYFPESSIFKKLVTGEYVKAEKKGQDPIDFRNYAKIFFALNELPPIKDAESEDVAYQMAQETPLKEVIQHCLRETEEYEALKAERDREKIEHTAEPQH